LPEKFYELQKPIADDLTQRLAWIQAVDQLDEEHHDLLAQVLPHPPKKDDLDARLALGKMFATLHRELAADVLDFKEVVRLCKKLNIANEVRRWETLAKLQEKYLDLLKSLDIWDLQTARLFAIHQQDPNEFQRFHNHFKENGTQFFLLGLVDMNRAQKEILNKFREFVTPLVFAPESFKNHFDEFGCLIPEAWDHESFLLNPPLRDDQITMAAKPEQQANAVLRKIAGLGGRYATDQIVIGVPDPQVIPFVEQRLDQAKLESRHFEGTPIKKTAVYRFLEIVSAFRDSQMFAAFAELIRHPDVEWFLRNDPELRLDLLSELDHYYNEFLPVTVSDQWQSKIDTDNPQFNQSFDSLKLVWQKIKELLGVEFPSTQKLAPSLWKEKIDAMLHRLYDGNNHRLVIETLKQVNSAVGTLLNIPEKLSPQMTFSETLRLILAQIESGNIAPHENPNAIELIGWLEIVMDDAPIVIITGMNDGFVPSYLTSDMFLPDKVRRELDLEDNRRRFARDAYALSSILGTRQSIENGHAVQLISGRRSTEGDPMLPSRLFFADTPETVTRRVQQYFGAPQPEPELLLAGMIKPGQPEHSAFKIPDTEKQEKLKSMRVTEFADYLRCPYRYYLKHRLRLENLHDANEELDAPAFGTLIHEVLKQFGRSNINRSTSEENIATFLRNTLKTYVSDKYGEKPRPVVAIQMERALKRLEAFAGWQAKWAANGHTILKTELDFNSNAVTLLKKEEPILLRGRIDRIDRDENTGNLIVLDYKTSDSASEPEKTHRKKNADGNLTWIDFQLPLYYYILRESGYKEEIKLGYVLLPKDTAKTTEKLAEWTPDDIQQAVAQAEEIARHILKEDFKIADAPPPYSEAFAAICLDNVLV
ncbi:MAG: PD-(D/E)XK nuclease family protein, partial [Planctomycetaceae bacterium]|jgi:CRISPR/Cas system-associated exonuclease Cas4 (RecB family)|nr:PD-(D/E)XK nuclease family protein [Planctomycetaceae bacterium]